MFDFTKHIILDSIEARNAMSTLEALQDSISRTLFIIDNNEQIVGTLTDGDIRRGLLAGLSISQPVYMFMNTHFKFIYEGVFDTEFVKSLREADIKLIPIIDRNGIIKNVIDLNKVKTLLPFSALLMAGGKGERLKPLTNNIPKPMLLVGGKPILEHNIDRLISYGISEFYISVKYLKEQIMDYFGDGSAKGVRIQYIEEIDPLGTIGAISLITNIKHEDILVMNSDILTNIDFEDFYLLYKKESAHMAVASIPYKVNIPYAVLEVTNNHVLSFKEKPTYEYFSNGGVYLMKTSLKESVPYATYYNATDLMDYIIANEESKLVHYPILNYWLDIGRHSDYAKAQEDIKHLVM